MKILYRLLLFVLLFSFAAPLALGPARAQSSDPFWSEPANLSQSGAAGDILLAPSAQAANPLWEGATNLSQSGAASQPRLLAAPDGRLQAFWWDRFDGLTSALYDGSAWGEPFAAPLPGTQSAPQLLLALSAPLSTPAEWRGAGGEVGSGGEVGDMGDVGTVHALWLDGGALLHSTTPFGQAAWSSPAILADSALAYQAALAPDGALSVAYLRTLQDETAAAGLYYLRLPAGQFSWTAAVPVHTSRYYRLLTAETAFLSLLDLSSSSSSPLSTPQGGRGVGGEAGAGGEVGSAVFLAWHEPQTGAALYAASATGAAWSAPQPLSDDQALAPARPRLAAQPDGAPLLIWQDASRSACALYQQAWSPTSGSDGDWAAPAPILDGLAACPSAGQFFTHAGLLYWLWGSAGGRLALAAWDPQTKGWSEAQTLSASLSAAPTAAESPLSDPLLAFDASSAGLLLLGQDEQGDIWFARSSAAALQLVYPTPSPWSFSQPLSSAGLAAADPALALDDQNRIHVVWSEGQPGAPASQILYARSADGQPGAGDQPGADGLPVAISFSRPATLVSAAAGEVARQPALLFQDGWLHLAWSGGAAGELVYSRANPDQAASTAAWMPPQYLSNGLPAAWPQLAADSAGRLYLLYVVPINEGRGVYLLRSADGGDTWSDPERVFDAEAAGWEMVGRPALAVTPSLRLANHAELHVAFTQSPTPGTLLAQGIHYTRTAASLSTLDPLNWPEPFALTAAGYDAPRLAPLQGSLVFFSLDSSGSLWQRSLPLASDPAEIAAWSTPQRLTGWQLPSAGLSAAAIPYALAAAGGLLDGGLYLAGPAYQVNTDPAFILRFSAWQDGRWASPEAYDPVGLPAGEILAAAAAARPQGVRLALAWVSLDEAGLPALRLAWRALPEFALPPLPTPLPTSTPPPQPTLAPTIAPSPTPDLNRTPPASAALPDPRLLGGGLAALIVVGVIVVVRLGWFRKPS